MQLYKIFFISALCGLYASTKPFFWVPNRYTAPFWSADTHITTPCIDSWDLYLGSSWGTSEYPTYGTTDLILAWYQTLAAGFFIEATMPLTSTDPHDPGTNLFAPLKNGLCYENCTVLVGWGLNYDNHEQLQIVDFIDIMVRIGFATPAHQPLLPSLRIETVYGYPAWGIPISLDGATGFFNWLTCGIHGSIVRFEENPLVWQLQPYIKADHFLIGLSAWFGYSYTGATHDNGSKLLFTDITTWQMHALHYGIEYEFIQSYFPIHPRIGAYYNQYVGGSDTLQRSNFGVTVGLDINW